MSEIYEIGKLKFNFDEQSILFNGKSIHLTKKENELLKLLAIHKNELLVREIALTKIWGRNDYFHGRSMDVYIAKLRKYLKLDENISIINVHGKGFILEIKN
ncbi:MAG: winged helix-turn-helix domain-containing protein [Saprospiraceae bacterium]|nr:winged helix-turn-helix domain-containing protein [Saprospiraceae bacterium]